MRSGAASIAADVGYRRDIQGLRAVAVVAVILYHANDLLPGGFVGVDVFFVISGFVITQSLHREHHKSGRLDLRDFYRRRVQRLTPALTLTVGVTVLLQLVLGPISAARQTAAAGLAASFLSANLYFARGTGYFEASAELNALLHTWSLSVEEQFYLVYPTLMVCLYWLDRRRSDRGLSTIAAGLIAISLASFALSCYLSFGQPLPGISEPLTRQLAFFMMPARAWQFGVGCVLALTVRRGMAGVRTRAALGVVGSAGLLLCFALTHDALRYPGVVALAPTAASALVLLDTDGPVARALGHRSLVRMGDVSYSWYLWHWPAIVFVGALGVHSELVLAGAGLAMFPLSSLTYERVEQRFRRPANQSSWSRTVGLSVAVSGSALALVVAIGPLLAEPVSAAGQHHADLTCDAERFATGVRGCAFGSGPRSVVLLGDSNAGHFVEAAIGALDTRTTTLTVVTEAACPMIDVELSNFGVLDANCRGKSAAVSSWLETERPDVAILAAASDIHLGRAGRTIQRGPVAGADAYGEALTERVRALERTGAHVFIVHPVPKFSLEPGEAGGWADCSVLTLRFAPERCERSMPRSEATARRHPAVAIETAVAARSRAVTLDPFDVICPGDPCSSRRGDIWLYRDARHISVQATELLIPLFDGALRRHRAPTSTLPTRGEGLAHRDSRFDDRRSARHGRVEQVRGRPAYSASAALTASTSSAAWSSSSG